MTLLLATFAGPAAAATVTTVMSGLDNPRGMAFGPEGGLYVAEAGRGGAGPCTVLRGQLACYGPSGALTRLWRGTQQRVATGLPSYLMASLEASRPNDVSFQGRGGAFVTIGFGGDPNLRAAFGPVGQEFGTLVQVAASGRWRFVADVSAHEIAENPGGGTFIDSNPFGPRCSWTTTGRSTSRTTASRSGPARYSRSFRNEGGRRCAGGRPHPRIAALQLLALVDGEETHRTLLVR